jgi:hypothetical protein
MSPHEFVPRNLFLYSFAIVLFRWFIKFCLYLRICCVLLHVKFSPNILIHDMACYSAVLICSHYLISAGSIPESRQLRWYRDGLLGGRQGFDSRQCNIFLFSTAPRPAPEPNLPPIQWVLEVLSLEVKRPVCKPEYSTPASAEVKNSGAIPPLLHTN